MNHKQVLTETRCKTKPEIKTGPAEFTMCYYIQNEPEKPEPNPIHTLEISDWGQNILPQKTKAWLNPYQIRMSMLYLAYLLLAINFFINYLKI